MAYIFVHKCNNTCLLQEDAPFDCEIWEHFFYKKITLIQITCDVILLKMIHNHDDDDDDDTAFLFAGVISIKVVFPSFAIMKGCIV